MNNTYKSDKKMIILAIFLFVITVAVIVSGIIYDKKRNAENQKVSAEYQKKELSEEKKADTQESAQAQTQTQTKQVKQDIKTIGKGKVIKYLSMGDSVTAGYGVTSQDDFLTNKLGTLITNSMGFEVQKNTIARRGELLSDAINNINQVNSWAPDLVTIEYGTNDANTKYNVTPVEFQNELNNLIDGLTTKVKRNPTIVLMTTWNINYGEKYDEVIVNVGKQRNIPVVDLKTIYSDKSNISSAGNKTFYGTGDDFNPNDKGMQAITNAVYEKVQPLLYEKASK